MIICSIYSDKVEEKITAVLGERLTRPFFVQDFLFLLELPQKPIVFFTDYGFLKGKSH